MNTLNNIGINKGVAADLSNKLNELLANYQILYVNVRGFHWNVKGEKFFELHVKFEELYNNLQLKIDELAERVLTLGHEPVHSFSEYLEMSTIREHKHIADGKIAMKHISESITTIVIMQRALLKLSGDGGDEGTNALMSDYIREQEKMLWMYNAYLN